MFCVDTIFAKRNVYVDWSRRDDDANSWVLNLKNGETNVKQSSHSKGECERVVFDNWT